MKIRLRKKGQITLPSAIINDLGLSPGDLLSCILDGDVIKLFHLNSAVAEGKKNAANRASIDSVPWSCDSLLSTVWSVYERQACIHQKP